MTNLELADFSDGTTGLPVDILIGLDFVYSFVTREQIRGENGGPVAVKSSLGWLLRGVCGLEEENTSSQCSIVHTMLSLQNDDDDVSENDTLRKMFERFWTLQLFTQLHH